MIKRVIFDLDDTLLTGDFSSEDILFENYLGKEEYEIWKKNSSSVIREYEDTHKTYNIRECSEFFSNKLNINFTTELVEKWIIDNSMCKDVISPNVKEILEYLKNKGYELSILTNWFKYTQEMRLKNADIFKYFNHFVYGEDSLKPTKESYLKAIDGYDASECIIIGDDLINDVTEPLKYGIDVIWYNKKNEENKYNVKEVKDLIEIKKIL